MGEGSGRENQRLRSLSTTSEGQSSQTDTWKDLTEPCWACGGGDAWIKTARSENGRIIRICDECFEVAREVLGLVIIPGRVTVAARCDLCWRYGNPRDFTHLRRSSGYADAYGGICSECAGE